MDTAENYQRISELDLEELEVKLLLDAIEGRYGYDFRHYAQATVKRRVKNRVLMEHSDSIADLIPKIIHDPNCFDRFLLEMSVTVTDMFRNPWVFHTIKEQVLPKLKTYPRVNIWHAGCATGEEVYSLAILLSEAQLLDKCQIYATDYNRQSLEIARKGIYSAEKLKQWSKNYLHAGGSGSFSDYYQANYDSAKMVTFLGNRVTFAHHNLMKDQAFAEMHLILCRNVLIYFDKVLQNRTLTLFTKSLVHRGFLVLGDRESIDFTQAAEAYEQLVPRSRIYRKKATV